MPKAWKTVGHGVDAGVELCVVLAVLEAVADEGIVPGGERRVAECRLKLRIGRAPGLVERTEFGEGLLEPVGIFRPLRPARPARVDVNADETVGKDIALEAEEIAAAKQNTAPESLEAVGDHAVAPVAVVKVNGARVVPFRRIAEIVEVVVADPARSTPIVQPSFQSHGTNSRRFRAQHNEHSKTIQTKHHSR